MKRICIVLVICLSFYGVQLATVASDDKLGPGKEPPCDGCGFDTTDGSGPYACALFEIMVLSSGTVYYCDFFDPDCYAEPTAAYAVGEYELPMECPYCIFATSVSSKNEFTGLPNVLSFNDGANWSGTTESYNELLENTLLDAPFTNCRPHFEGWMKLRAHESNHFTIVVRVEFARGSANRSGSSETRYVALEVDRPPSNPDIEIADAESPQRLPGGYAYRARYAPTGQSGVPVLVLLAR